MTGPMEIADKVIKTAIGLAPDRFVPGATPDPLRDKHGALGAPVSRVDGPLKVAGQARFAGEVVMEDMLYAALAYSSIPRGRIATLDTAAAVAAPGVALVMTYRNAPKMAAPTAGYGSTLAVMQDDQIHWNGEPIAVVLAETHDQADHAASLIRATYHAQPAVTTFAAAKEHARTPPSILRDPTTIEVGHAEKALAEATIKVDRRYRTPRHNHNAIELHAVTLAWAGDRLTVHDANQGVNGAAQTLAQVFGLKPDQVRVVSPYVGGGFGGKTLWSHHILAAGAARLAGRPVRMTLSREGVYRIVGGRTLTEQRVALAAKEDGTLAALIHTGVVAMTTHNSCPEQFSFPARHLYAADSFYITQQVADMDMLANTFMRAPGESVGTFALECAIDELAEQLKLDPIELRRRIEPATDPTTGNAFSARHIVEAYEKGAAAFGWDQRPATPRSRREGEWLIGMGCATATYPYYRMPGGAARIRLTADGRAVVEMASHEMGMGTATVQAQHAALRLGLPIEAVSFVYGDTDLPPGTIAGGSSQTASIGAAIIAAYDALVPELLKLAGNDSPLAGLSADEVVSADGGLCKADEPGRCESYVSILRRAGRGELAVEAAAPAPLEFQKYSMHSYGAQFAEVWVSEVTGEVRVRRFLGSFDCGRILNAKTATSQFKGGIIMGIGLALSEETLFDERTGRVMNPSLSEYHVPVQMDVPAIDILWTDIPDPHSPMGARGIGEIGITGVAAAIANAVYNATGKRARDLPITLDKVM
ncbi:MAG: dehydrogenase [Sphingomonas bacterium]|uniref:xanthine dehydrogenase family protein molybdopterin-binding subunit n=1 Tax=Sphingomonas bacterium TaxID=1895847 RepID=UPI002628B282|nr:xanthine dehydrogenase family protein molybdopterin-binding subunit [Sphingomonas bacterium]MDB5708503.1 dehydrogenase [Sphingomonas bacterium]